MDKETFNTKIKPILIILAIIIIPAILIITLLVNCKNEAYVPPQPTPIVQDTEWCQAAEINLQQLDCIPDDQPYTKKGLTFTQFCEQKHEDGVFLNPKCLATEVTEKTTCSYVDVCTGTAKR